jgi:hypothetical protein
MKFWDNIGDNPQRTVEIARVMERSYQEEFLKRRSGGHQYLVEQCGVLREKARELEKSYNRLDEEDRITFVDRIGACSRELQEAEESLKDPNCPPGKFSSVFTNLAHAYAEVTGMERSLGAF